MCFFVLNTAVVVTSLSDLGKWGKTQFKGQKRKIWTLRCQKSHLDIFLKIRSNSPSMFEVGQVRWRWSRFFRTPLPPKGHGKDWRSPFFTFKLRFHPFPEVGETRGHHSWIQCGKMNKVLSYLKRKRLKAIGDLFLRVFEGFWGLAPPPKVRQWGNTYPRVQLDKTDALIGVSPHTVV